jgi:hypothetical protein
MEPNSTTSSDTSQLDPSIVALMHGLKTSEGTNGNYNAIGDEGTAAGIGQWSNQSNGKIQKLSQGEIPTDFQSMASQYGLNPSDFSAENQNKVMYAQLEADKKAGLSPEQALSKWNSGNPNAYANVATSTGTGPVGAYNVSAYVTKAMKAAQQYAQQNSSGLGTFAPAAQAQTAPTDPTPSSASAPTSSSGGFLSDLGGVVKGIGNFLFPIVGDVYNDVTGQNKKSFLQQVGDTGLSALSLAAPIASAFGGPEIEAGDLGLDAAAAGGDAVTDAAAQGAGAATKSGLVSTMLKGAGVGYGAGVASNLSQGKGIGQSLMPGLNTIGGAVLGGATPALLEGASSAIKGMSGIDPAVQNELSRMGSEANPEDLPLMDKYNAAAKAHATNVRTPSVENLAASNLDTAADKISQNTAVAGQAVGAAKQAAQKIPLGDASSIASDFANEVKTRYGVEIGSDPDGHVILTPVEGSMRQIDPSDLNRIKTVAQQLNVLGNGATVGQATDVIANINDDLERSKGIYGKSISPVDQLFTKTASDLNDVVRTSAPDLATANDRYSGLKNLQGEVREIAGNKLQRGELLMKRVFSDKSQESLDLFDHIKQETGIDLTKHAVLAKNAIDNYGSNADKSLLEKMISGATESSKGILGTAYDVGKSAVRKTIANPTRISRELLAGKGSNQLLRGLVTTGAIRAGSSLSGLVGNGQ